MMFSFFRDKYIEQSGKLRDQAKFPGLGPGMEPYAIYLVDYASTVYIYILYLSI